MSEPNPFTLGAIHAAARSSRSVGFFDSANQMDNIADALERGLIEASAADGPLWLMFAGLSHQRSLASPGAGS